MPRAPHLTAVVEHGDPVGAAAVGWVGALSERAGEPVAYAFALALARRHGPPAKAPRATQPPLAAAPARA